MTDPESIGVLNKIKLGCFDGNFGELFLFAWDNATFELICLETKVKPLFHTKSISEIEFMIQDQLQSQMTLLQ